MKFNPWKLYLLSLFMYTEVSWLHQTAFIVNKVQPESTSIIQNQSESTRIDQN